ncbi:MAG: DUF4390 domain-containing protein [Desulfobulbaceae bacterium]|nr:MAG: DUF4390 domain-containing protein [Desulfobulbaceae bacterium]
MNFRSGFYVLAVLVVCIITTVQIKAQTEYGSSPYFTDTIVTTSDSHLLLFSELRNSLTEEMLEGLHSGIPVSFLFFLKLEKSGPNWPNNNLVEMEFNHRLSFDTLKELYTVTTDESSRKKLITPTLSDALEHLNSINGLKIIELKSLNPDGKYKISIKADLYKKTLPMSLHTYIPFLSWWDLNTDWFSVEFTY